MRCANESNRLLFTWLKSVVGSQEGSKDEQHAKTLPPWQTIRQSNILTLLLTACTASPVATNKAAARGPAARRNCLLLAPSINNAIRLSEDIV